MQPPVALDQDDDIRDATEKLIAHSLRELPVVDAEGRIVGFLDEAEISRAYLEAALRAEKSLTPPPMEKQDPGQ